MTMTAVQRCLLVDNYDSYTYNLFQLIAEVTGEPPVVIRNDECTWPQLQQLLASGAFWGVVISPGPGTPATARDIGVCLPLLQAGLAVPILGVCLGMQAIALAHGGQVQLAPEPVHGRVSEVQHSGHPLFAGIPSGLEQSYSVVRYHSLAVDAASLPACLEPIAWTCWLTMLPPQHKAPKLFPRESQFEAPFSFCWLGHRWLLTPLLPSPHSLVQARAVAASQHQHPAQSDRVLMGLAHRGLPLYGVQYHPESVGTSHGQELIRNFRALAAAWPQKAEVGKHLEVQWQKLPQCLQAAGGSQQVFLELFGQDPEADCFWLDSSTSDRGRFSFFGGRGGALWQRLSYKLPSAEGRHGDQQAGQLTLESAGGNTCCHQLSVWDHLQQQLQQLRIGNAAAAQELPFEFWGGFVGFLGYELKAECGGQPAHTAPTPDAAMFLADRFIATDKQQDDIYVVTLVDCSQQRQVAEAEAWLAQTHSHIMAMARAHRQHGPSAGSGDNFTGAGPNPSFSLRTPAQQYLKAISACRRALQAGQSYELCLTNAFVRRHPVDAFQLYLTLRELNPAPYAAWLSFPADNLQLCCSSPERFLHGSISGVLEARPIKGTAPRSEDPAADAAAAADLAASEKDRAENLMIVDLLRNDLGRVCEVGSVHVPGLMEVESFATVHQLVSTVRGQRRTECSVVDCIRAAFPGGSMTGAPKVRSMELLDGLEQAPRGVYSGSIGYISLNSAFDLNIVIRTAVVHRGTTTIGAGGAIVWQSEEQAELEEMQLKARALLRAVSLVDNSQ
eukprot:jgi/Astpho2/7834/fgenesh1_pm.00117_%23_15_t